MSGRSVRFVHTSDVHLELPLHGVSEVPEQLKPLFLDAPFRAAERVFDTAVEELVDFVVISGDLLGPRLAGPRGLDFVLKQFRRLQAAGIGVYWTAGRLDRFDLWPSSVPLPSNVRVFSDRHVETAIHRRDKVPIANIQGCGTPEDHRFYVTDFDTHPDLPTIAAIYGKTDSEAFQDSEVDYWALGGVHAETIITSSGSIAHYSGSPQGRNPSEESMHGCSLVEIDERGHVHRQTIATDVVRWHTIPVEMPDQIDVGGLLRLLRDRTNQLLEAGAGRQLFVRWILTDEDELTDTQSDLLAARLREGGLAEELLDSLRQEFKTHSPGIWHLAIEVEPPTVLPAGWYEEDTVLGDLLRATQRFQTDKSLALPTQSLPADSTVSEEIAAILEIATPDERELVLRRVAALGVDLLRGDRVLSEEVVPAPTQPVGSLHP